MNEIWAAGIKEYGHAPEPIRIPEPRPEPGTVPVRVLAASFNPVDRLITSGEWYGGNPTLPAIPGREAVGIVQTSHRGWSTGDRVYLRAPASAPGVMAELVNAPETGLIRVPDNLDSVTAAAVGFAGTTASLALRERAALRPGETVLILGSTGAVGRCATQLALLHDAHQVIAVGRADSYEIHEDDSRLTYLKLPSQAADLTQRITRVAIHPVDVVIDLLWGKPAQAVLGTLGRGGRLVNVGSSAGPELTLSSEQVRSKPSEIRGHTNAHYTSEAFNEHCAEVFNLAASGLITVPAETFNLATVGLAWERMSMSPRVKVVIDFERGAA